MSISDMRVAFDLDYSSIRTVAQAMGLSDAQTTLVLSLVVKAYESGLEHGASKARAEFSTDEAPAEGAGE